MKNKLLSILNELDKLDLSNFFYSLTIDFDTIIQDFKYQGLDINEIRNILDKYSEIESYNLSITNLGRYKENQFENYYSITDIIFHSEGIVFTFSSPYLSNKYIDVNNIHNLMIIHNEHVKSSQILYNLINESKPIGLKNT